MGYKQLATACATSGESFPFEVGQYLIRMSVELDNLVIQQLRYFDKLKKIIVS
jgi:hypothetical protein